MRCNPSHKPPNNNNYSFKKIGPNPKPNPPNTETNPDALLDAPAGTNGQKTFARDRVVDPNPFAEPTSAEDTMTGSTSKDVHRGLGYPVDE